MNFPEYGTGLKFLPAADLEALARKDSLVASMMAFVRKHLDAVLGKPLPGFNITRCELTPDGVMHVSWTAPPPPDTIVLTLIIDDPKPQLDIGDFRSSR